MKLSSMYLETPPQFDPPVCINLPDGAVFRITNLPDPIRTELVKRWNAFNELVTALHRAVDCLDYCGWGDSYERNCFKESGDMKLIEGTVAKYDVPSTEDKT